MFSYLDSNIVSFIAFHIGRLGSFKKRVLLVGQLIHFPSCKMSRYAFGKICLNVKLNTIQLYFRA